MEIDIEIYTKDNSLIFDLLRKKSAKRGDIITISEDVKFVYKGTLTHFAVDVPSIIHATIEIGGSIAIGIVSAWLYDRLKGRAEKIKIDRTVIEVEEGEIRRIIEEKIRY